MSSNGVPAIPGARRLIHSLRDMGYEFETAVADLVDNSIEARATTVRITVDWDGEQSSVVIADNGIGMAPADLREALRFGSEREYDGEDLGKFGLGLKTASLSQCRRVTVASRKNEKRADIEAYCWDLDHIHQTNRWEILPVKTASLQEEARLHLKETPGTVIIWQRLDRILGYQKPGGEFARKQLHAMCRALEDHLAMVFHRFLQGEVRGRRLAIYINDNKISPWDPFARTEEHTSKMDVVSLPAQGAQGKSYVVLEPYVLPAQARFSTAEACLRASGPNRWNRQQGLYIYRADRMIQSGGWSNLRTLDEHLKLARVALFFSPRLDDEFKINVPKMRVALPAELKEDILKALAPTLSKANKEYRFGSKGSSKLSSGAPSSPSNRATDAAKDSNAIIKSDATKLGSSESADTSLDLSDGWPSPTDKLPSRGGSPSHTVNWLEIERVSKLLNKIAMPEELPVIKRVLARAKQTFQE